METGRVEREVTRLPLPLPREVDVVDVVAMRGWGRARAGKPPVARSPAGGNAGEVDVVDVVDIVGPGHNTVRELGRRL